MAPQRPGHPDLYVVGVAGDGSEEVFLNEIMHLEQLSRQRLDAEGRSLLLANHDTRGWLRPLPEASERNLAAALAAVGAAMDTEQDLLLLYLTTHGTPEHSLLLRRPGLDDELLDAPRLRALLDQSGIRHRVLAISACFSGGFIPALRSPETLVIAAARADRASFGCGSESAITFFGRAWLVDGLNATVDFAQAFANARSDIAYWERLDEQEPSLPQIRQGREIGARLSDWRARFTPGPALPFGPEGFPPLPDESTPTVTPPLRPGETAPVH